MRRPAVLATLIALVIPVAASAAPRPPLDHSGRWITDHDGRVVILHGVNMVYKVAPYFPKATGFGRDDARFLARHGFNTVRLGLIYAGVEPEPAEVDTAYLRRIAQTERTLGRRRIFSLLDFHQDLYNERFQGEGFPDWAVQDDGLPNQPQVGFPGNYFVTLGLNRAFDNFWANAAAPDGKGLQTHYARAFKKVARRFRSAPHVLGYDIFNEPWPGTSWPTCVSPLGCPLFDSTSLTDFTNRVLGRIREVDPTSLTFYEPNVTFDFGAQTAHADTGDEHAAMSFHTYCLPSGLGGGTLPAQGAGCGAEEDLVFDNADSQSQATGDALLLTEYGATDDLESIDRVQDFADDHMVGWQEWHYCACGEPTSQAAPDAQALVKDPTKPPRGENVKREKLDVMERPYPQAVAGTPQSFDYDSEANTFELSYSTTLPAGGKAKRHLPTEVYVPRSDYRGGYDAHLIGGEVISKPGARVLKLRRDPGADTVEVSVVPAP